jgi:hypothetical protein
LVQNLLKEYNKKLKINKVYMPQMDNELFIEYIYGIFIVLLHFYSSFYVNTHLVKINLRKFITNNFYFQVRTLKEQENIVKIAFENFNKKTI